VIKREKKPTRDRSPHPTEKRIFFPDSQSLNVYNTSVQRTKCWRKQTPLLEKMEWLVPLKSRARSTEQFKKKKGVAQRRTKSWGQK
jgi:hypothetical protein